VSLRAFKPFRSAAVESRIGIGAVHAVIVALRYLSGVPTASPRREMWRSFIHHVERDLTVPEREIARGLVEEIEQAEKAPIDTLVPQRADFWIQELAELATDLSRAEVDVDPDLGQHLLVLLRSDQAI
jgi:hypothetical protein